MFQLLFHGVVCSVKTLVHDSWFGEALDFMVTSKVSHLKTSFWVLAMEPIRKAPGRGPRLQRKAAL